MKDKEQRGIRDQSPGHSRALGKAIKVIRAERELSRTHLAKLTGLSYPYISEIEGGKKSGSSKSLRLIAEALGMRLQDLYEAADRLENGEPAGLLEGIVHRNPKSPSRGSPWFRDSNDDPGVDDMAGPAFSMGDMPPLSMYEKPHDNRLRRELHRLIDHLSPADLDLVLQLISRLSSRP